MVAPVSEKTRDKETKYGDSLTTTIRFWALPFRLYIFIESNNAEKESPKHALIFGNFGS